MTNLLTDDLAGLDFGPASQPPETTSEQPAPDARGAAPLQKGGVVARMAFEVADGTPIIVAKAPPGGGKTTALAQVAALLANRVGLDFTVACPRREQAKDLVTRLVDLVHPSRISLQVARMDKESWVPDGLGDPVKGETGGRITVRTVASLAMSGTGLDEPSRLLVMDEAWQVTFNQGAKAAAGFEQVLCVGDPGQIPPIVSVSTRPWDSSKKAPHHPFAAVMAADPSACVLSMDATFRLGADTTAVVNRLYDFPFISKRKPKALRVNGVPVPEVRMVPLVHHAGADRATALCEQVADRVKLLSCGQVELDFDGVVRPLDVTGDVAVVVALNAQVTLIAAMLEQRGVYGVTVGTADKLQGRQWPVVIALDPLSDESASEHHLSLGRLCVMLSRHNTHLSFLHDGRWSTLEQHADPGPRLHFEVRQALAGVSG